jgi:cystinosin
MAEYEYLMWASYATGWVYFVAWSLSFYPQVILNYNHKSVAGFSIDFAILNVSGFLFYSMYSIGGFIYPHLGTGVVHQNDMFFALHAFVTSSILLTQVHIYHRGNQS